MAKNKYDIPANNKLGVVIHTACDPCRNRDLCLHETIEWRGTGERLGLRVFSKKCVMFAVIGNKKIVY
jgi:hypothetical protein